MRIPVMSGTKRTSSQSAVRERYDRCRFDQKIGRVVSVRLLDVKDYEKAVSVQHNLEIKLSPITSLQGNLSVNP